MKTHKNFVKGIVREKNPAILRRLIMHIKKLGQGNIAIKIELPTILIVAAPMDDFLGHKRESQERARSESAEEERRRKRKLNHAMRAEYHYKIYALSGTYLIKREENNNNKLDWHKKYYQVRECLISNNDKRKR